MSNKPVISSPDDYQEHLKHFGYNQVLKVGNTIKISGQGGWVTDSEKGIVFKYNSIEEEIEQAFKNVEHVLNSVGASWKDVYEVDSFHVRLDHTVTEFFAKLFKKYIGERGPLWTCVGVTKLGEPEMNVEIKVVAYVDK